MEITVQKIKLTKSILKQIPFLSNKEIINAKALGYVINPFPKVSKLLLLTIGTHLNGSIEYRLAHPLCVIKCDTRIYIGNNFNKEFDNKIDLDFFYDHMIQVIEEANTLGQIFI